MLTLHAIESRYRKLFHELSKSRAKAPTPAQAQLRRELGFARAGWQGLASWLDLDDADLRSEPAEAMADASLALLGEGELRAIALVEIARLSLDNDKPSGWRWCLARGFDATGPEMVGAGDDGIWGRVRGDGSWMAKALSRQAWNCARMLALAPEGRAGQPCFEKAAPVQKGAGKRRRMSPEMEGMFLESKVDWFRSNDPTLMEWARGLSGDGDFPAAVRKALKAGGFEPSWGDAAFDLASAQLALEGSPEALAGCVAHSISAAPAIPSLGFHRDPLDLHGGLLRGKDAAALWGPIAQWIDSSMGAGSSGKMVEERAFEVLRVAKDKESSWDRSFGEPELAKALDWLSSHGPSRPDLAPAQLGELQGFAIEWAEAEKGRASKDAVKLAALIERWDGAVHGAAKPRRVLKA